MRVAALLVAALAPLAAQPDIRTVVERSLETADRNWRAARNYTFVERSETRSLDGAGKLKERKVKTFDITLLEGTPYRRLIARDDRPLSPADERAEQEKLRHSNEERKRETGAQRKKRIDRHEGEDKSALEVVMTVLHAGGKFSKGTYKVSGGLHGVGASVVNALSEWCEVKVRRDGKVHRQMYRRGDPVGDVSIVGDCKSSDSGTTTVFKPDFEIDPDVISAGITEILACE